MKTSTRLIAVLLSLLLAFSCVSTVFAAEEAPVAPSPADNEVDLTVYVKTVLADPKVKAVTADMLFHSVNGFADVDGKQSDLLKQLLTGQNVIELLAKLVDLISESLAKDPQLGAAAGMIKYLFANDFFIRGLQADPKFAPAIKKFEDASEQKLSSIVDIRDSGMEFTSADFGFTDGDAYGFLDAVVCSLLELCSQLNVRSILGDFTDSVSDGVYCPGNYHFFLPIYELLELEPLSSVEFTTAVTEAEAEAAENASRYARLRTAAFLTLRPVANLLTKVENKGLDAVIDCLPKLLYALDSGMANDLVRNLLKDKSLFGLVQFNDLIKKINISTSLLWDLLDRALITGTADAPAGFDLDHDGVKETPLPLTREQFDTAVGLLTYAADPNVSNSLSVTEKNRLALKTDASLVRQILAETLVGILETEEGSAFAAKAADGLENGVVRQLAKRGLSLFGSELGRSFLRILQLPLAAIAMVAARVFRLFKK